MATQAQTQAPAAPAGDDDDDSWWNPKHWFKSLTGGLGSIGGIFDMLWNVVFWGAIMAGVYWVANHFKEPIAQWLDKLTPEWQLGTKFRNFMDGAGNKIQDALQSLASAKQANDGVLAMTPEKREALLTGKGMSAGMAKLLAPPDTIKLLVDTVSNATKDPTKPDAAPGDIRKPFAAPYGAKVLHDLLTQPSTRVLAQAMIKQAAADSTAAIAGASASAASANNAAGSNAAPAATGAVSSEMLTDLTAAFGAMAKDPDRKQLNETVSALFSDNDTRQALMTVIANGAQTSSYAIKLDPAKLDNFVCAVGMKSDGTVSDAFQKFAVVMTDSSADAAAQQKAMMDLITSPEVGGARLPLYELIHSASSTDAGVTKQLKFLDSKQNIDATIAFVSKAGQDNVMNLLTTFTPSADGKVDMNSAAVKALVDKVAQDPNYLSAVKTFLTSIDTNAIADPQMKASLTSVAQVFGASALPPQGTTAGGNQQGGGKQAAGASAGAMSFDALLNNDALLAQARGNIVGAGIMLEAQQTKNAAITLLTQKGQDADKHVTFPNLQVGLDFVQTLDNNEIANAAKHKTTVKLEKQLTTEVVNELMGAVTAQKGAPALNADKLSAFFSDRNNASAFYQLLDRMDVSTLPKAQQDLVHALHDHWYHDENHGLWKVFGDKAALQAMLPITGQGDSLMKKTFDHMPDVAVHFAAKHTSTVPAGIDQNLPDVRALEGALEAAKAPAR